MAIEKKDRVCENCAAYHIIDAVSGECRKTHVFQARVPEDWCLEFFSWVPQDHPGADPLENWKLEFAITNEDTLQIDNPLGRDIVEKVG